MFGYVKPVKAELLVREDEFYRATYCGVCRAMKKHTGALSNVTLSYDSVFLALVRMLYIKDESFGVEKRRCIAHPLKSRAMLKENPAIEYTARAFAILTYYKMADDLQDEKLSRRLLVTLCRPIASSAKRRASMKPLAEIIKTKLDAITLLEKSGCKSVDDGAELFGELLGEVFAFGLDDSARLVPYECGRRLGRFIYSADAAEDYEKDRKSGAYNPYVLSYGGAELTEENKQSIKCALLLECKGIEAAANLLPYGTRATIENIINNVIYLGLVKRIEFLDKPGEKNLQGEN